MDEANNISWKRNTDGGKVPRPSGGESVDNCVGELMKE